MKTAQHTAVYDTLLGVGRAMSEIPEDEFLQLSASIAAQNPWFTPANIRLSWDSFLLWFHPPAIAQWLQQYPIENQAKPLKVGVVMAGNLPGVGFHDLLCVLAAGHHAYIKPSSKDTVFIKSLAEMLAQINPEWGRRIGFPPLLKDIDALIATGSDNTVRHFDYYFAHIPRLIRGHRSSAAVLHGAETPEQIRALGHDIFAHFGLGCRNVTKLYIPQGFDITALFPHWETFAPIIAHSKYLNNYEYYKSIFLVNRDEHLDTGFLLIRNRPELFSPVSVLHYEFYEDNNDVCSKINADLPKLQCLVSEMKDLPTEPVDFGQAQFPLLTDYADGVDTMKFLGCL